ncbi:hypothetical protein niasHT_029235 [Heterodera trifolii]|uniref:Uncharacterized protein n=1 Tax=Heterodera trifolii TaxID=157864 RepID=A0ABD2JEC8_9BILA
MSRTVKMTCHLFLEFNLINFPKSFIRRIDNANANDANFEVTIHRWDGSSLATSALFNALSSLKVTVLDIRPILSDRPIEMQNLGLFFPKVQKLTLFGMADDHNIRRHSSLNGATFLRDLPMLKALKALNVDFNIGDEEAQWCANIERMDFANCSFGGANVLPRWMPKCRHIGRISVINCGLRSALQLAHIGSAVQIRAKHNQIGDLHRVAFECTRLKKLDLSYNEIAKIGAHTLARCHFLRFLDLSDNPMVELPDKLFQGCRRLKDLRLERLGLRSVRAELFLGLNALKSLSLSGNPLSRIDPFTFLPARSIRALRLDNCTLAQMPLAVTQCCLLDSLSMDDNRLATRNSMPALLLALLPRLSHFSFARNPLLQLPWALFLYEHHRAEEALLEDIVDTLVIGICQIIICSAALRRRMAAWNEHRMHRDGLAHCGQLYETIIDGIGIYRELREHNGCEATRRLRSVRADGKNAVGIRCDLATPSKAMAKEATKNIGFNWHQNKANKNQNVKSHATTVGPSAFAYGPNGTDTVILGSELLSTNACQPAYNVVPMGGSASK